jgi:hypothetical protein
MCSRRVCFIFLCFLTLLFLHPNHIFEFNGKRFVFYCLPCDFHATIMSDGHLYVSFDPQGPDLSTRACIRDFWPSVIASNEAW